MKSPLQVVYITGSNHSGTTLLDLCLGSHSKIVSLGEIAKLQQCYAGGLSCSCGESLPSCPFWKAVERELQRACGNEVSLERWAPDLEPINLTRFRYVNVELLKAIRAVTGKSILVDSSKFPSRLQWYLGCSDIAVTVIHLLRHPLGLAGSYHKTGGRNGLRPLLRWRARYGQVLRILQEQKKPVNLITVRYEDFASDPERILSQITRAIGVGFEKSQLEYYETTHHIPWGNPLRLSLHQRRPIVPDMEWTKQVPLIERIYLWSTGSRLLSRLGYKVAFSNSGEWLVPFQFS